ncbi:MAG TPA: GrpB family protein [Candidatus Acidoferrales bacterium]|nr:GrpB family protein [Candidatus Acidoferrales bacterium]
MTELALGGKIRIVEYDSRWPEMFAHEAERIRAALGERVILVEHVGSTAVPGLAAKPVIDVVLVVADSREESAYAPQLEADGFRLTIREPEWHQHRMFKGSQPQVNLHVFSRHCMEVRRMLAFRDWLCAHDADRDIYARAKLELSQKSWKRVQDYADAKIEVVEEIVMRALDDRK